jgi:hypothetical protein
MEEELTFEEYVEENYPEIVKEYERYVHREDVPKVGDWVKSLVIGFGGNAGKILKVTEVDEEGITLSNEKNEYYAKLRAWYKYFELEKKGGGNAE